MSSLMTIFIDWTIMLSLKTSIMSWTKYVILEDHFHWLDNYIRPKDIFIGWKIMLSLKTNVISWTIMLSLKTNVNSWTSMLFMYNTSDVCSLLSK